MNDSDHSKMDSNDEPLFVLKYRGYKVALRVVFCVIAGLLAAFFIIGTAIKEGVGLQLLFVIIGAGMALWAAIDLIINMVRFQEVRLYRDRITEIREYAASAEVRFADAKLEGYGFPVPAKRISDRNTKYKFLHKLLVSYIKDVNYDESLADPQDVQKVNSLLADISGRTVEEFEARLIIMDPLVKEGRNGIST